MSPVALGWGIAGVLLLAITGMCWTGRWRGWVESASPFAGSRPMPVAPILGMGVFGVSYPFWALLPGPAGGAALVVGLCTLSACLILFFWSPRWFGPRWFREFRRAFYDSAGNSRYWMTEDWRRPGESSVDATERHRSSGRPLPPGVVWVWLHADPHGLLGGRAWRRGSLGYWPQALAAAVTRTPMNQGPPRGEVIPAESIVGVAKLRPGTSLDGSRSRSGLRSWVVPRVRIDTTEGPWLFEFFRAKPAVEELRRRYIDRADGPEPSWLLGQSEPAKANRVKDRR